MTELQKIGAPVQHEEERFRLIVEAAPNAMLMIGKDRRIVLVNRKTEDLFGYRRNELLGRPIELLVPERFGNKHPDFVRKFFAEPATRPMGAGRELFGQRKDGCEVPIEIGLNPIETGEGVLILASIIDITERKRAEDAHARLAAIVESSGDAIISKTLDGIMTSWNRGAERLFGYAAEEAIGQSVFMILPGRSVEEEKQQLDRIRRNEPSDRFEARGRRKDGTEFDVSIRLSPIRDAGGTVVGASSILRDISDRKTIEMQLLQSQKMEAIGNLTGGMAHDFNNLLGIVIGNLDLLTEGKKLDSESEVLAVEALEAALRGADLVQRLLAFARRQPLRPQPTDINELVGRIAKLLQRTLAENIEIDFAPGENVWPVVIDPVQLKAGLVNIANNARDAMPGGGRLDIVTGKRRLDEDYIATLATQPAPVPGDYAIIEVSDTGTGMPPDVVNRIFEPFFTTKEQGKGTGLGLSMVFGFVKQSGGHISAYSEVGVGTTFRLYLPRAPASEEAPERGRAPEIERGGHETILAVEDNPRLLRVVARQIADLGYRLFEAENGPSALKILEREPVDLVFTDVVMAGGMSGYDLAHTVLSQWPSAKVVLTSGFANAKPNGGNGRPDNVRLLTKPYRKSDLARILREVLDG